ncbi:MAG: exo-beta-N-acetylmuramidase NamZ domain-containing protein [Candidatus Bipolaricaulota bacterium]
MCRVKSGLSRLVAQKGFVNDGRGIQVEGKSIGLITNQTGVTQEFEQNYSLISRIGGRVTHLFAPEHGLFGLHGEAVPVPDGQLSDRKVPVVSLYDEDELAPPLEILDDLDLLIYDIQDLGVRCYTYIYSMVKSMKAAAQTGTQFVILDRPAPLSGDKFNGRIIEDSLESFIGGYGLPLVYGATPGEFATYAHSEYDVGDPPAVVKMQGWRRDLCFDDTDLPWVAPSPSIPTFSSVLAYPATVFLEATNVSEGRGTTKPFELLGASWIQLGELAEEVQRLCCAAELKGFKLRSCRFRPRFSKYHGEACSGVELYVTDREEFRPFEFGMVLTKALHDLYPREFCWWNSSLERGGEYFDRLSGSEQFRRLIEEKVSVGELVTRAKAGLTEFEEVISGYFLYDSGDSS